MINTNWGAAPNPEVYRFWASEKGCNIDRFKKIKKECKKHPFRIAITLCSGCSSALPYPQSNSAIIS